LKLNADLSKRAVMHSESLEWVPSPLAGVERRMLERDGDEVARATSVVRYAPGSHFSPHTHHAGEEFLVLEGVFSDESGDYPRGMYVRNPPGSRHAPSSEPGCTILVKLRQIPEFDHAYVRRDDNDEGSHRVVDETESVIDLHDTAHERVQLVTWHDRRDPSTRCFADGAEYFVLEGSFEDEQDEYVRGSWLRLPPGSRHTPFTRSGCRFYLKTGHLSRAAAE